MENGPSIRRVGTWIKSKRGQRLGDRAISDLEESRSSSCHRSFSLLTSVCDFLTGVCGTKAANRSDPLPSRSCNIKSAPRRAVRKSNDQIDTMAPREAICLLLVALTLEGSRCDTRYFVKMRTNASELFKTKSDNLRVLQDPVANTRNPLYDGGKTEFQEDERMIDDLGSSEQNRRNSFAETSTFNPDVLNKFLEEYASKIKSTTEKNPRYPFRIVKPTVEPIALEVDDRQTARPSSYEQNTKLDDASNSTSASVDVLEEPLNDTLKRNKYYGANSYDDRNGWVTLEAIPWSKSKISKWQANPTTQRPWPDVKPWEKPTTFAKPWASDYSIRPIYENNNNKPWYEKPKPNWPDNHNDKPWQKPTSPRPSYYPPDKHQDISSHTQKWPPERPSWNKYGNSDRPGTDIITDDRPANFPNNWNRPQTAKPSYQFADRYSEKNQEESNDWHDFPSRYDPNDRLRSTTDRPGFSQYQYVHSNHHPPNHPANGDGQWVLLSTNRGYSKSRQRSIKIDAATPGINGTNTSDGKRAVGKEEHDPSIAVMTSKRQVRLTVLPSINGTNTTTSHGGLLEVEKTFKSVEQSRNEYEREKQTTKSTVLKKRPIRNTLLGQPSNSAVLAAVGAGMLPATMAMMIPMMLGRRKRDSTMPELNHRVNLHDSIEDLRYLTDGHRSKRARTRLRT